MLQNYTDLKEVLNYSGEVYIIDSEIKFREWYNEEKKKQYNLYRGINDASYKVYSSSQVQFHQRKLSCKYSYIDFLNQIDEFSKIKLNASSCIYNQNGNFVTFQNTLNVPISFTDNLLFRFFYLQHIGIPTHLIDFSEDLDVALFFAVDKATTKGTNKKFVLSDYIQIISLNTIQNNSSLRNICCRIKDYNGPYTNTDILKHYQETTKINSSNNNGLYISTTLHTTNIIQTVPSISVSMDFSNQNNIVQKGWLIWNNTQNQPLEEIFKNGEVQTNRILISKNLLSFLKDCHLSLYFTKRCFNYKMVQNQMYPLQNINIKNDFWLYIGQAHQSLFYKVKLLITSIFKHFRNLIFFKS